MAIRIQHPEHGYHNVYNQADLETHIKRGWSKVIEKAPEPTKPIETMVEVVKPVELPPIPVLIEPQIPEKTLSTYPCEVCGKVFAMKMHLGAHKRKHKE